MLAVPIYGFGDEVPVEVMSGMTKEFNSLFCLDAKFLQCTGVSSSKCSSAVENAIQSCDYAPVWSAIESEAENDSSGKLDAAVREEYGACINEAMQRDLRIAPKQFEECAAARFFRLREAIRKQPGRKWPSEGA